MKNKNDIVALNDSQILRWICELNNCTDLDNEVKRVKRKISYERRKPKSIETKREIKKLYDHLYLLQYQEDYLCVIMDSNNDYDMANKSMKINGITYKRLLGTNGGIKKSTITYVSERLYPEIKKRLNNGRDMEKPLVPAKLEAYQALICSASIPVTQPRIIVVPDCNVKFTEDIIKISDENDGEPLLTYEQDYEIEYCDSDGYGLMSPEYSKIVNCELYGENQIENTISGINTRYAWTKGMLFTFDFEEFARQKNNGNYMIIDAWGDWRDVREADVILTTSMLKLWDFYDSWEDYFQNCQENHYQFAVAKTTPHRLENSRNANYQFLQSYNFSDEEIKELCYPTIQEISDVLGGDVRKTIVFLKGMYLDDNSMNYLDNDFIKALMIDSRMINDPFVVSKVYTMIKKRICMAAKGSLKLSGNFAIVSGDPYSLSQSIFGLPVTGLLKRGEIYHRYWIDKGVSEVSCFRAPMTCHNNIRKRNVVHNEDMDFWYQYNTTGLILNSWDTTCDALNGADKDSDTFFTTDNKIIVKNTLNLPTIECIQRKAEKIIPTEADMVQANKLAFGDEIGSTTNIITSMIEVQSQFQPDSKEYKTLAYRIMCGQHYQQCAIDKAKGIIAKPMPKMWYNRSLCKIHPDDDRETKTIKELNLRIVADKKPYFMKYVYPDVMAKYNKYIRDTNNKCIREFKQPVRELEQKPNKTVREKEFLDYYRRLMPVGNSPCVINRIAWLIEEKFDNFLQRAIPKFDFDYSILRSDSEYSGNDYNNIVGLYDEYLDELRHYQQYVKSDRVDKDDSVIFRRLMVDKFRTKCIQICPDEFELCNILLDICYTSNTSKQFVWDVCGDTIIKNLLKDSKNKICYPQRVEGAGDFEFSGEHFIMCEKQYEEDEEVLLY